MSATADPRAPLVRSLVSPEGVDLRLRLAAAGERAAAFLIDVTIIAAALLAVTVAAGLLAVGSRSFGMAGLIWLAGFFVLRNFYFALFEMRRRAATPGKRAIGLRVVSQHGGRLSADAILARNLMRELEIFMPLNVYLWGAQANIWLTVAGLGWTGIFALFPLFNRDRMRVGDLIAGTWVVHVPRRTLLPDLAERRSAIFDFTTAQIDVYGVHELHTLEQVLRARDPATMVAVAARIRAKIAWAGGGGDIAFLDAFYAALRTRLEGRLLFGHRRRDKFDQP